MRAPAFAQEATAQGVAEAHAAEGFSLSATSDRAPAPDTAAEPSHELLDAFMAPTRPVRQIDTVRFQNWFGDSAIVDEHDEPLVVFHGTTAPENFAVFSVGEPLPAEDDEYARHGSGCDPTTFLGSHFAMERSVANRFSQGLYGERQHAWEGGRVYPVFLKVERPFHTTEEEMLKVMHDGNYGAYSVDSILEGEGEDAGERYDSDLVYRREINDRALGAEQREENFMPDLAQEMAWKYRHALQEQGYDGIIYANDREGGTSVVVFSPLQIKSAIGNRGDFDPENEDIRQ
jgi:hypothetical protein